MEEDSGDNYEDFMYFEHKESQITSETATQEQEASSTPGLKSRKNALNELNSIERNRAVMMIVRALLRRAPFPAKYKDISLIVKQQLPSECNHFVVAALIEEAKKSMSAIFGLSLCDNKLGQGKRELYLKQSLAFPPHDLKITTEGDHELRGFLILLIPCIRAYSNALPLDRLCEVFRKIGKEHMTPKSKEEEEELVLQLKNLKRRKVTKRFSRDFKKIIDYIFYARDLSYISISFERNKGSSLDSVIITPSFRLIDEFNKIEFLQQLKTLDPDSFRKGLEVFFED